MAGSFERRSASIQRVLKHALRAPFFRKKWKGLEIESVAGAATLNDKVPITRLEDLVAEEIRRGDPFSSRWCNRRSPRVVFQLDYDTGSALYLPLDRSDLQNYAEALRRCWSLIGVEKGDIIAIFDYGTSPVSYLASSAFTPYLKRGAAEALGCVSICNDGVSSMSQRAVDILRFVRPRILCVRADCLAPLAAEIENQISHLSDYTGALIVSENEGFLSQSDQKSYERRLGVPVYRLLRADLAMFLAMECPECRLFHTWADLYWMEILEEGSDEAQGYAEEGSLVITNAFAKSCPMVRYLSQLKASLQSPGCSRGPADVRIST